MGTQMAFLLIALSFFAAAAAWGSPAPLIVVAEEDALKWIGPTRSLIDQKGIGPIIAGIKETLERMIPGPALLGMSPLVEAFLHEYSSTKVLELKGIVQVLEERSTPEMEVPSLREMILLNLLLDMAEIFPTDMEGTLLSSPKANKVHLQFGKHDEERVVVFGHVSRSKGEILVGLMSNGYGKAGMEHFLSESTKALKSLEKFQPIPKTLNFNTSRCVDTSDQVICSHKEARINTGIWLRSVLWEVPDGEIPPGGWPVVLHFQGSFFAPHLFSWSGAKWMPFGAYEQTLGIKKLLDAGYAVITPETHLNGFTFWDTNIPPYNFLWEISPDHLFMQAILKEISNPNGLFGYLNNKRKHATGISSGGYMTSRMAISYAGEFRSLAVCSASYAVCTGPVCAVPPIPLDHPPTLFLHGLLDPIVPIYTMELYYATLSLYNIPTRQFVDPLGIHEWVDGSSDELLAWFQRYP